LPALFAGLGDPVLGTGGTPVRLFAFKRNIVEEYDADELWS
jgi:hypothetical protein